MLTYTPTLKGETQRTPTTNQSLLADLREEPDSPRLDEFARLYEPVMRRYAAYAIVRLRGAFCDADRDDLAQEAFLAVRKTLPGFRYDPSKGRFRNYLAGIIRHLAFRSLKSSSEMRQVEASTLEAVATDAAQGEASTDEREMMFSAWSIAYAIVVAKRNYTPNTLAVFQSHVLDGVPAEEVAAGFKLTANAVYQIKDRIVRAVRAEIHSAWTHSPSGDLTDLVEELYRRSDALQKGKARDFFTPL